MKNLIIAFAAGLLFPAAASAQEVKADSLTAFLCKKWVTDYAMMEGMKIGAMPGAAQSNYEFLSNKTFVITDNDGKEKAKGTWIYVPEKNDQTGGQREKQCEHCFVEERSIRIGSKLKGYPRRRAIRPGSI